MCFCKIAVALVAITFLNILTVRAKESAQRNPPKIELREGKPWAYVSELIKDWSQKYQRRSDILMLNIDTRSSDSEKIMKEVSKFNPVVSGNPNLCLKRMEYNFEFVVITTRNSIEVKNFSTSDL